MSEQEMVFDSLVPREVPVTIGPKKYVLREATGDVVCRYRNSIMAATRLGPEGRPQQLTGLADTEPYLISMCLFEVTDGGEKPVTGSLIRSWPSRVQRALFKRVREISDLEAGDTDEDETKLGNSPEPTTAG